MSEAAAAGDMAAEHRQTTDELRQLSYVLHERIKELDCLYGISHIVENSGGSLEFILQETVRLLPKSWQYPKITCARVVLRGDEYTTENYAKSPWVQRAPLHVHGEHVGDVEVSYLEQRPESHEGPFLTEERRLLDEIAKKLGHIVERLKAQSLLQEKEHELRRRLTHLSRVSTMGEMASNIAHEVNQPLTAIGTYAQACSRLLKAGEINTSEVLDVLRRIAEEALRAGGIIRRLRDLVRRHASARARCDLNDLIRDVEQLASLDSRLHNVRLRLVLARSLPPVLVDSIQIQQVILNLVRNGIDALEGTDVEPREVVIRTVMRREDEIELSVCDNGCGLPDSVGEELFDPFFTTKEGGIGVGLSVSRSIVAAHGGRMWFSRNAHRGTTFFFTIPTMPEVNHGAA